VLHSLSDSIGIAPLRLSARAESARAVAEEIPVALVYNHATYAVMMATPAALDDFALGFSLTEGIIESPDEIRELEILPHPNGMELRMELAGHRQDALLRRRRRMAGPVGCGLCGIESLDAALRTIPPVTSGLRIAASDIPKAMAAMEVGQALHRATRCAHAAGFWHGQAGILAVREDVGRHNALDKLAGAVARLGASPKSGAVVLTSRVSVEMVQKTAVMGATILIAVSAPTAMAIRIAQDCGMTLISGVRGERYEIFTHPERVLEGGAQALP
jgi:FdhD protein